MIISAQAANAFIHGYSRILQQIHAESGQPQPTQDMHIYQLLMMARNIYMHTPSLLDQALATLQATGQLPPEDVVEAVRQLRVSQWVYLKDTRYYSVFMHPTEQAAYAVQGLTNRLREVIGGTGALIEVGMTSYAGHYISDSLIAKVVWLGPQYKRELNEKLAQLRQAGHFYAQPASH